MFTTAAPLILLHFYFALICVKSPFSQCFEAQLELKRVLINGTKNTGKLLSQSRFQGESEHRGSESERTIFSRELQRLNKLVRLLFAVEKSVAAAHCRLLYYTFFEPLAFSSIRFWRLDY